MQGKGGNRRSQMDNTLIYKKLVYQQNTIFENSDDVFLQFKINLWSSQP